MPMTPADFADAKRLANRDWNKRDDRRNRIGNGAWRDAYVREYDRLKDAAAEQGVY